MEGPSEAAVAFAEVREVEPTAALAEAVDGALAGARARWPLVTLDPAAFARFLAARVDADELASACVDDLLLADACLRGDRAALGAFEALLAQVPAWVRRPAGPAIDELTQRLRTSLLVGADAGLAGYRGRGALHAWLRVCALRLLRKLDAEGRAQPLEDVPAEQAPAARTADPVRALAGAEAGPVLADALGRALASLTSKQRALLRLRHTAGVTDEQIGRMYGVHQSTATRWIAAAHEAVALSVRHHLRDQLRLRADEVDSIVGAGQSRLDVSLSALLRTRT
ncbi:MAG TPA: helix-turn-helix domain-containing protein [Kofleriaceae bacterium]|nr:helix-turn-helix domain-containing protein [Kofleriaceae bacterium]